MANVGDYVKMSKKMAYNHPVMGMTPKKTKTKSTIIKKTIKKGKKK